MRKVIIIERTDMFHLRNADPVLNEELRLHISAASISSKLMNRFCCYDYKTTGEKRAVNSETSKTVQVQILRIEYIYLVLLYLCR